MPKLKVLSGEELVKIFHNLGFKVVSQRGSHIKLQRIVEEGSKQILTIPLHKELDRGTVKAIYRRSLQYISEQALKPYRYHIMKSHEKRK